MFAGSQTCAAQPDALELGILEADYLRALMLLAGSPHGRTSSTLIAHGYGPDLQAALVACGLAAKLILGIAPNDHENAVVLVKLTAAGRAALAERLQRPVRADGENHS
jgi:hypothetical protein